MEKGFSAQKRMRLEKKMTEALKDEMKMLTKELQQILADDLVTAFHNRLVTLLRIQSKQTRKNVVQIHK